MAILSRDLIADTLQMLSSCTPLRRWHNGWWEWKVGQWKFRNDDQILKQFQNIDSTQQLGLTVSAINRLSRQAEITASIDTPRSVMPPFWLNVPPDDATTLHNIIPLASEILSIDMETGELTHQPVTKDLFNKHILAVTYTTDATCPLFDHCMEEWFPLDTQRRAAWETIAYCLIYWSGLKTIPIMHGVKDSGKTLFANVIEDILGPDVVTGVQLHRLDTNDRQSLLHSHVNFCSESQYMSADVCNTLKMYSSGGDKTTIDGKWMKPVDCKLGLKIIISGNDQPMFSPQDQALWDRLILLHFQKPRFKDTNLRSRLKPELSAIFSRAVGYLQQMIVQQGFSGCTYSDEKLAEYRSECDNVAQFIDQGPPLLGADQSIEADSMYRRYEDWAKSNGYKPVSSRVFKVRFEQSAQRHGYVVYTKRIQDITRKAHGLPIRVYWMFGAGLPGSPQCKAPLMPAANQSLPAPVKPATTAT